MTNKLQYWIELNRVKLFYKNCWNLWYTRYNLSTSRTKWRRCPRNDFTQTNKESFFIRKSFFFFSNLCISLLCYLFHFVWIFFRLRPPKAFSKGAIQIIRDTCWKIFYPQPSLPPVWHFTFIYDCFQDVFAWKYEN